MFETKPCPFSELKVSELRKIIWDDFQTVGLFLLLISSYFSWRNDELEYLCDLVSKDDLWSIPKEMIFVNPFIIDGLL